MESSKVNGEEQPTIDPAMERGLLAGKKLALDVPPGEEVVITGTDKIKSLIVDLFWFQTLHKNVISLPDVSTTFRWVSEYIQKFSVIWKRF